LHDSSQKDYIPGEPFLAGVAKMYGFAITGTPTSTADQSTRPSFFAASIQYFNRFDLADRYYHFDI
jgi:hypothetical protein